MSDNVVIICYPEMNDKIIELLRMSGDAISLYAAQRIEDLEKQIDKSSKIGLKI